jgi:hypothetical protein
LRTRCDECLEASKNRCDDDSGPHNPHTRQRHGLSALDFGVPAHLSMFWATRFATCQEKAAKSPSYRRKETSPRFPPLLPSSCTRRPGLVGRGPNPRDAACLSGNSNFNLSRQVPRNQIPAILPQRLSSGPCNNFSRFFKAVGREPTTRSGQIRTLDRELTNVEARWVFRRSGIEVVLWIFHKEGTWLLTAKSLGGRKQAKERICRGGWRGRLLAVGRWREKKEEGRERRGRDKMEHISEMGKINSKKDDTKGLMGAPEV